MTDLDATAAGTRTCPACGAQNASTTRTCEKCGATLTPIEATDASREDLELEEAWRAAAAEGFDADAPASPDGAICAQCRTVLPLGAAERVWLVRDTPTDRHDLAVLAIRCPVCGTANRAELDRSLLDAEDARDDLTGSDAAPARGGGDQPESDPSEVDWRHPPPEGATPEHPLGADRQFFEDGGPGTLADQRELVDEQGEDIRQYTGEPVETEEGWVIPQQQNVGPGNEAGGGEWPDPATPSSMPKGDEPAP